MKMLTTIPFSGFYYSWHSDELEREAEQIVSDSSGCNPISKRLAEDIQNGIEWNDANREYSKQYAEYFAHWIAGEFDIELSYESMSSPKEYNFQTDRIFCTISTEDAHKLLAAVKPETLAKVANDHFTSCPGFISFYSNDVTEWGSIETWDHNQLGALIDAAVIQSEDSLSDLEYSLMDKMVGNGVASQAVDAALNNKGKRLAKIAHYLRERAERKQAS